MPTPRLRPMTDADLEPVVAGILADDWGDRRAWFTFALGHPRCRVMVAELDGEVVGTGVATLNGPVAWIGTIWVAAAHRRRGLGTTLTEATLEVAEASGCPTQVLVATREGRPLYERLGFEIATSYVTMEAPGRGGSGAAGPSIVRAAHHDEDVRALATLDRAVTGEDRGHLLGAFVAPATTRIITAADDPSAVRGFLVRPPWGGGATIATDPEAALALLDGRRDVYPADRRVRCGILEQNLAGLDLLHADGWTEAWRAPRLHRGEPLAWNPERIWGQFNHAMG